MRDGELYTPLLVDCYDRGGWFYGLFDDHQLIAVSVLESKFIGARRDQPQLKFLHVSHPYRGRGLGRQLFEMAQTATGAIDVSDAVTAS